MSFSAICTISRLGTTIATNVPLRFINMSPRAVAEMGGASPYNSYWVESELLGFAPDLRTSDHIVDPAAIDPKTGNPTQYTVFGNPWTADKTMVKVAAEKLVGKVPA
jgi:hypothetical protein